MPTKKKESITLLGKIGEKHEKTISIISNSITCF